MTKIAARGVLALKCYQHRALSTDSCIIEFTYACMCVHFMTESCSRAPRVCIWIWFKQHVCGTLFKRLYVCIANHCYNRRLVIYFILDLIIKHSNYNKLIARHAIKSEQFMFQ